MSDFAPGDAVVCVDAGKHLFHSRAPKLVRGKTYRVLLPYMKPSGRLGLCLAEFGDGWGWLAERFRKLDKADEQFTETVRACKPIKQPVPSESDRSLIYSLAIEEALERSRVADERVRVWIEGRVK